MLAPCIYVQVAEDLVTKTILGEHTFDGMFEHCCGPLRHEGLDRNAALTSRITGVVNVFLLLHFVACKADLVGIDDDDIVTTVNVGGEVGLVLSAENDGNAGSKAAKNLIGGVDYQPLFGDGSGVSRNGLVTLCVHFVGF